MNEFMATELAYTNGYNKGLVDLADKIISMTESASISHEQKEIIKETLEQLVKNMEKP